MATARFIVIANNINDLNNIDYSFSVQLGTQSVEKIKYFNPHGLPIVQYNSKLRYLLDKQIKEIDGVLFQLNDNRLLVGYRLPNE